METYDTTYYAAGAAANLPTAGQARDLSLCLFHGAEPSYECSRIHAVWRETGGSPFRRSH